MSAGRHGPQGRAKIIVLVAVLALIGGAGIGHYLFNVPADKPKASNIKAISVIGSRRPDFSLQTLDGQQVALSKWDGKLLVINFWATWCPPCRREIPAFIELQEKYESAGFSMLGVAIDNKQAALDFVDPMGINYPIFLGETAGIALNMQYGNQLGVLPYTVIVDRQGIIRYTFSREVHFEEMEALLKPLL